MTRRARHAFLLLVAVLTAAPTGAHAQAYHGPAQDYEPAPAMWRLADADTTIYLLGTVHMLPEGFRWRNPQLEAVVDEADELVLESSDADAAASLAFLERKFARLLAARTPTSLQLSPEARGKWVRLVEQSHQPVEYIDRLPLMVALMYLGMSGTGLEPTSYEHGVESVLQGEFDATGRPIRSIEDTGRVMMSLYQINDDLVLADLESDLIRWDGGNAEEFFGGTDAAKGAADWELETAWARGEVQQESSLGLDNSRVMRAFRRAMLTNRNRRWAQWLEERLDAPGTALVAVGAGHFEGPDSLLAMLRQRGLEAERINAPVH